jgi:hypothetical protein
MNRIVWICSAALAALAVPALCGCGGGASQQAATAAANSGSQAASTVSSARVSADSGSGIVENGVDSDASQCVAIFLDSLRRGDERAANAVLTNMARTELAKTDFVIEPLGTPEGEYQIGRVGFPYEDKNLALVECTWLEPPVPGEERVVMDIVCEVQREAEGWRISGMGVTMPGLAEPLVLDFEDSASLQATIVAATQAPPPSLEGQAVGQQAMAQQPTAGHTQAGAPSGLPTYPAQQPISVEDSPPPQLAYPPQYGQSIQR